LRPVHPARLPLTPVAVTFASATKAQGLLRRQTDEIGIIVENPCTSAFLAGTEAG
jgi:hypothetical protein